MEHHLGKIRMKIVRDQHSKIILVPLLSGGLDSAIALSRMMQLHPKARVEPLLVDRNQRAFEEEKNAATHICQRLGLREPICVKMPMPWYEQKKKICQDAFPYGRNMMFAAVASSYAAVTNPASENLVILGFTKDDAGDTSKRFVRRLNRLAVAAIDHNKANRIVRFVAPLISYTKGECLELAVESGMGSLFPITWSCYENSGVRHGHHCGVCKGCQRRIAAYAEAELPDPTCYEKPGLL